MDIRSADQTERICFTLQVRKDRLDEYRRAHAAVWPEMLRALSDAGWHDYRLFLREDGLVVGCLESNDFSQALAAMNRTEINSRWQAEMGQFFEGGEAWLQILECVFDLNAQFDSLSEPSGS